MILWLAMSSCSLTRYVPENEYLLNKAHVVVKDTKDVTGSELRSYLRQKQNTEILGFWKLQLSIWNTAPRDTTTRARARLAHNAHKMGEAPEIYDPQLTQVGMQQLKMAMQNRGWFDAQVDTSVVIKEPKHPYKEKGVVYPVGKKLNLTYTVTANAPYKLRKYEVDVQRPEVRQLALDKACLIHEGEQFSSSRLDDERKRIATAMQNDGYYHFDHTLLEYVADSALMRREVDVRMQMAPYLKAMPDSLQRAVWTQYQIRRVWYHIDHDPSLLPDGVMVHQDSDKYGNIYTWAGHRFLRNRVLRRHSRSRAGQNYSAWRVERTYSLLNSLAPVRYVDIAFDEVDSCGLDCHITISRAKMNTVAAEVEGTYSAGDWGIAAGVRYANKNIFHGAEQLALSGRGSYEWRQNGGRAIEGKAEASLTFPSSLKVAIAYDYQKRPDEYTRTIAAASLGFTVPRKPRSRWTHRFQFIDINYVYLPWISDQFRHDFLEKSSVLKSSYDSHFILDFSYAGSYSSQRVNQPYRSYLNFNYTLETAGNALYGLSTAARFEQNKEGQFVLWNIPFAQYAKADLNLTFHHVIQPKHQLVSHLGVGVAVPYLNASAVPFEKRYFAGGSNSVRGWQARTLGPGGFRGMGGALVYDLQAGDVRLDMNLEYRWKVWQYLELAAFLDAGNIWTIREYEQQPFGAFKWTEFYKQIAFSYGVGVRLDFSLLIFRIDFGVKLHDPTRIYGALAGTEWRTVPNGLCWKDDMTFHFAIGYPF